MMHITFIYILLTPDTQQLYIFHKFILEIVSLIGILGPTYASMLHTNLFMSCLIINSNQPRPNIYLVCKYTPQMIVRHSKHENISHRLTFSSYNLKWKLILISNFSPQTCWTNIQINYSRFIVTMLSNNFVLSPSIWHLFWIVPVISKPDCTLT